MMLHDPIFDKDLPPMNVALIDSILPDVAVAMSFAIDELDSANTKIWDQSKIEVVNGWKSAVQNVFESLKPVFIELQQEASHRG